MFNFKFQNFCDIFARTALLEIPIEEFKMNFVEKYKRDHQHPINKLLHSVGIPVIVISLPLAFYSWEWALALFVFGWVLQFIGHWFEGVKPSFLSNPIFLLVGPIWWVKKTIGWDAKVENETKES